MISSGCGCDFAVKVRAMADHKFKIGQSVLYHPRRGIVLVDVPRSRSFQVTAVLRQSTTNINTESEAHSRSTSARPVKASCGSCSKS
jgi:hypothetical protein